MSLMSKPCAHQSRHLNRLLLLLLLLQVHCGRVQPLHLAE
jgi:hypothetical protein